MLEIDQLRAHRQHRIEGSHRVLEDHRDILTTQGALRLDRQSEDVLAFVAYLAPGDLRVLGQQVDHRCGQSGLAAAAFAHDADHLSGAGDQAGTAQGGKLAVLGLVGDAEGVDFQKRGHRGLAVAKRGSSASRSPSPRKVKPRVARTSGAPAAITRVLEVRMAV